MRKISYIILFVLASFVFLSAPKALYGNTISDSDRSSMPDYGVNKKWAINDKNLDNVLNTPVVDVSKKIYDFSNVLTDSEKDQLKELSDKFLNDHNMEMIIVTVDLPYSYDKYNETFAADFYDYNDFGINLKHYDGILLVRNTYASDPYYDIYTFGSAQLYFDDYRYNKILDDIYNELHVGFYFSGFKHFISIADNFIKRGKPSKFDGATLSELNEVIYNYSLKKNLKFILIFSLAASLIYLSVNKRKNKMIIKAQNANEYIVDNSFELTRNDDEFITSRTTSYKMSSSSSGGGGGHSSHGSSGGGHSSGGGRHG